MATYWYGNVTATNGSNIVQVNSGDNVNLIAPQSLLAIGDRQIVEVESVNTSNQTIVLARNYDAGTTTQNAVAAPVSVAELRAAIAKVDQLIELSEQITGEFNQFYREDILTAENPQQFRDAIEAVGTGQLDVNPTNNSVAQRTANGRVKTSNATESNDAVALGQAVTLTGNQTIAGVKRLDDGLDAASNLILRTGGAERARIDSSGNVGIGTSSPGARLQVAVNSINTTAAWLTAPLFTDGGSALSDFVELKLGNSFFSTNIGQASIRAYANVWADSGSALAFHTMTNAAVDAERMRIDRTGNVGIGTSSPAARLDVTNNFRVSGFSDNVVTFFNNVSASSTLVTLRCQNGLASGTTSFLVRANGNVENTNNSYGAISDAKLKENIEPSSPKLDKLMQVDIVNYNLIGQELKQIGVVAQQLEEVFPSMVQESDDYEEVETTTVDEEGNETTEKTQVPTGTKTKSVKYSVFVPILIKAMQEQQEIIKALEARIEALEG